MNKFLLILGLLTLSFFGCGKEDGSKNETTQTSSPQDRWPEEGYFSYQFNDNGCNTGKKEFEKKWEYCVALSDRQFNSGCARDFRKSAYKRECGEDFEEKNFGPFFLSGYDSRLKTNCRTAEGGAIASKNDYCAFLKDETKHEGCFWDYRRTEFLDTECKGDFSSEPRKVEPAPNPNPNPSPGPGPGPNPGPAPNPTPNPQPGLPPVVQELEAAGIQVTVMPPSTPEFPGEKPFREKLKQFWVELEAAKGELLKRKSQIRELVISSYTKYRSTNDQLVIDVSFQSREIQEYFQYFDRKQRLENAYDFTLDMGIEIYGHEERKFQRINSVLQFFESRSGDWKKIRGAVKTVEFRSYSSYYPSQRSLLLDEKSYEKSFSDYVPKLQPLSNFFTAMDSTKVRLELDFDLDRDFSKIKGLFPTLEKEINNLKEMISQNRLATISLKAYNDEARYWKNLKELWIPMENPGVELFSAFLKSIRVLFTTEDKLGIPVESLTDNSRNIIIAADRLSSAFSDIEKKKAKIRRIALTSRTGFSSGTLYIGYEGSLADLKKILSDIR